MIVETKKRNNHRKGRTVADAAKLKDYQDGTALHLAIRWLMTPVGAASPEAWGQVAGARGDEESAHVDPSFCTFSWEDKEQAMAVAVVTGF